MRLKTLSLKNFRQFFGLNEIVFSCDSQKNVTVILGDNTFGKTTLLQAFNWCFYGSANFEKNPADLLNYEVEVHLRNGEETCLAVKISFEHDNREYFISRTRKYTKVNSYVMSRQDDESFKVSYRDPDGNLNLVRPNKAPEVLENILPQDLSGYFFFDSERVNSISSRKDLSDAVKGLLGLSVFDSAIKHLGDRATKNTVIGNLYSKVNLDSNNKFHQLFLQVQRAEAEQKKLSILLTKCNDQLTACQSQFEKVRDFLRDKQNLPELQKQKELLEERIAAEQENLSVRIAAYFQHFNIGALSFFLQPLLKKADAVLNSNVGNFIPSISAALIEEILKSGHCICGQPIHKGDNAHGRLMSLLYSEKQSGTLAAEVRTYRAKLSDFSRSAVANFEDISQHYRSVLSSRFRLQELTAELSFLTKKIKDNQKFTPFAEKFEKLRRKLAELQTKKDSLTQQAGTKKNELARLRQSLNSVTLSNQNNQELFTFIEDAESVKLLLEKEYCKKETALRANLELKVNEFFCRMYTGKRRVVIDSKYNITLQTNIFGTEKESGESEGTARVKNFAFIAGLVSLATISEESYPLIIDAPFSNMDEQHIANISKILPDIAEQVIVFIMHKDWQFASAVMKEKVGCRYSLKKVSETFTKIQSQ